VAGTGPALWCLRWPCWLAVHAVSRSLTGRTAGLTRELSPATEFVFREAMHGSTDFRRVRVLARRGFPITQATNRNLACEVLESGVAIHMPEHRQPGTPHGTSFLVFTTSIWRATARPCFGTPASLAVSKRKDSFYRSGRASLAGSALEMTWPATRSPRGH
jgi:hypothetical protein